MRRTKKRCNLERTDGDGDWSERERLEGQSGNMSRSRLWRGILYHRCNLSRNSSVTFSNVNLCSSLPWVAMSVPEDPTRLATVESATSEYLFLSSSIFCHERHFQALPYSLSLIGWFCLPNGLVWNWKKYSKRPNTSQKRSNFADESPILHDGGPMLFIIQGFDLTSCWNGQWDGDTYKRQLMASISPFLQTLPIIFI